MEMPKKERRAPRMLGDPISATKMGIPIVTAPAIRPRMEGETSEGMKEWP
jgi:hypothetical protein